MPCITFFNINHSSPGFVPFLDQKFKDFSRTFKDVQVGSVRCNNRFICFLLFCVATFLPGTSIFELGTWESGLDEIYLATNFKAFPAPTKMFKHF